MNKIRMLKDLEMEELKKILFKNTKMVEEITSAVIQCKMEEQEEYGRLMLGNNFHKYIELRDNYNSFFLRLKDWNEFFNNLDREYLNVEGIEMYNKIKKDIEIYENEEDEDKRYEQEEQIEKDCELLLKICENILHEFEEYPTDEEIIEHFIYNEIDFYDYYVDNNDVICLDIAYTKKFN